MRSAAAALGVALACSAAHAQECSAGQRQSHADAGLAFRFRPSGISGGGSNDRTLVWTAEDEGGVAAGDGLSFTMTRNADPLANFVGAHTDEGEFIEPCLASTGCPEVEESCFAIDEGTACDLTPMVPDDERTDEDEFEAGFCTPQRGGTCGHQPAEFAQAALSPELGGLYWESGDGAPYEQALYSNKKVAIGAAHTAFFVFTQADSSARFSTLMGMRPNAAPGSLGFMVGSFNCDPSSVACLYTNSYWVGGYTGPAVQAGVPTIAIFRSKLDYNSNGDLEPVGDIALVTASSRDIIYTSGAIWGLGLNKYDIPPPEEFDFDWRDQDTDGLRAAGAGYL